MISCLYLSVVIEALQYVPSPVSVLGVLRESVHVKQTLHSFWSQQVVSVRRLEDKGELVNKYLNHGKGIIYKYLFVLGYLTGQSPRK